MHVEGIGGCEILLVDRIPAGQVEKQFLIDIQPLDSDKYFIARGVRGPKHRRKPDDQQVRVAMNGYQDSERAIRLPEARAYQLVVELNR